MVISKIRGMTDYMTFYRYGRENAMAERDLFIPYEDFDDK